VTVQQQPNPSSRDDVLMEFALDQSDEPVRERLARFVGLYPEHASALARLALDLEDFDDAAQEDLCAASQAEQESAIDAALAAFHETAPSDPFLAASPRQLRELAAALDANVIFVACLKDRMIEVKTMTDGFLSAVAGFFSTSLETVRASLSQPPRLATGMEFKAKGKPGGAAKKSFEDALQSSGLSETQQEKLRSL
jgi:hypothetical protein